MDEEKRDGIQEEPKNTNKDARPETSGDAAAELTEEELEDVVGGVRQLSKNGYNPPNAEPGDGLGEAGIIFVPVVVVVNTNTTAHSFNEPLPDGTPNPIPNDKP